jgi:putative RNA 2'-phosphotransferase
MSPETQKRTSKFLSLVLRHEPEKIGIRLNEAGWTDVDQLLAALAAHGKAIPRSVLETIVAASDKKRFAFSADGRQIRANQGHSVTVELGYEAQEPPELLYHGTATRFLAAIQQAGLLPQERHHVHLSADEDTAKKVGARHGKPVILTIRAGDLWRSGKAFFRSENGVWLTAHVPPEFFEEMTPES